MLSEYLIGIGIGLGLTADSWMRLVLLCLRMSKRTPPPEVSADSLPPSSNGAVILIAAHNEAGTIGRTVQALENQLKEWPHSRLWVVADRSDDTTAEEAANAGAKVAVRSGGCLGKCAVISWWLENYPSEWQPRDAVVILDADSRLKEGSLGAFGRAMADSRTTVAQSFVAPDAETKSGRLAGWSEVLMQRIDDEARRRCGWPVPLRGTGMAFRGKVLAQMAPRLHTLAEDLEMDVMLAAAGYHVAFVPEAIVYDPKPQQVRGASRQRARWFEGQLQVLGGYSREFIRALIKGGIGAWFLLLLLMMRPKILFIAWRMIAMILSFFISQLYWPQLFGIVCWLVGAGLTFDLLYYLAGATFVENGRRYLLDLLAVPRYATMWIYSLGIAAFQRIFRRGHQVWLRAGKHLE